jgi:dynein heavy chain 1
MLQNGVNRWIREIQKVTKLDRDPSSGNALQEISFWLNLEKALQLVQEKSKSIGIMLTLDILKYAKRFHATVSFDSDTGLDQAMKRVSNYSPLMKDFPLEQLLSATELDKIRDALVVIFTHFKKIKTSQYPIVRCMKLIDAISKDLMSQMLKVLGTRRLMLMNYDEFDGVMVSSFSVFTTWEEEYDRLTQIFRDINKKKKDDSIKQITCNKIKLLS